MVATKQQVTLTKKSSGIAICLMDCPGRNNVLNESVTDDLEIVMHTVETDPEIKAFVIMSGKPHTFLSGADISEIRRFTDAELAYSRSKRGQNIFNRLRAVNKPTVIAINGVCLGGGLEMALGTHVRIATNSENTILGLPELRLGLIPGLGGTQRLPRLVGLKTALELIIGSQTVSAEKAKEIGLIDIIVEADNLMSTAEREALKLIGQEDELARLAKKTDGPFSAEDQEKQQKLFAMMDRSIRIRTKGHYPAHTKVLQVMQAGLTLGMEAGLEQEARVFGELAAGQVSKNLISAFLTCELAKASAISGAAKTGSDKCLNVGIIGGGIMGVAIAHLSAVNGHAVIIKGRTQESIEHTYDNVVQNTNRAARAAETNGQEADAVLARVKTTLDYNELANCDLVIEAATEKLETKQEIFSELSKHVRPDCILASNTSSLLIADIAKAASNPDRVFGLHFFHPAEKMPLVELIVRDSCNRQAQAGVSGFVTTINKTPLVEKDGPGFLANRILCYYLLETARMLERQVPAEWLEQAAVNFGLPMGPLELMDIIGLDVSWQVARSLGRVYPDRFAISDCMVRVENLGVLGKKQGTGFYDWDASGKRHSLNVDCMKGAWFAQSNEKVNAETAQDIAEKLLLPMVDEAAMCLEEKIVARPRDVDLALILGCGFPPFRGGLLRWADSLGIPYVRKRVEGIYADYPHKRQVSNYLLKLESEGRGFYGRGNSEDS